MSGNIIVRLVYSDIILPNIVRVDVWDMVLKVIMVSKKSYHRAQWFCYSNLRV